MSVKVALFYRRMPRPLPNPALLLTFASSLSPPFFIALQPPFPVTPSCVYPPNWSALTLILSKIKPLGFLYLKGFSLPTTVNLFLPLLY